MDSFTVVCIVTRRPNGSEAGGDLVVRQTSLLLLCKSVTPNVLASYHAPSEDKNINFFLMLTSCHLNEKNREVCIKARSPPSSLACIYDQLTEHITEKLTN